MDNFIELTAEELKVLKVKYKVDYPLHLSTISTIDMFIERFNKHPEWLHKVKFYSFQYDWQSCGSFLVVMNGYRVYFNTLEDFPHAKTKIALMNFGFQNKITFINIRDGLRPLLLEVIRLQHFDIVKDIGTRSIIFPKTFLSNLELEVPEGFYIGPLRLEHVDKINDAWKGKFNGSKELIADAIKLNTSMGIYDQTNRVLVGWNMRLDTGAMSVGAIDKNFEGRRLGRVAILGLAKKIYDEYKVDVFFEVVHGNELALKMINNLTVIDTQSWISVMRKKSAEYAIWGHL